MLLNLVVVWSVSFDGFILTASLLKSKNNPNAKFSAIFFWAIISLVYFLVGCGALSLEYGFERGEIFISFFVHAFSYLSMVALVYYLVFRIFRKVSWAKMALGVYAFSSLFFLYKLYTKGVSFGVESNDYFDRNVVPNPEAEMIFLISVVPLFALAFYALFCQMRMFFAGMGYSKRYELLSVISLLLFSVAVMFDQMGIISRGWLLIFDRVIIFSAILLASVSFPFEGKVISLSEKGKNEVEV